MAWRQELGSTYFDGRAAAPNAIASRGPASWKGRGHSAGTPAESAPPLERQLLAIHGEPGRRSVTRNPPPYPGTYPYGQDGVSGRHDFGSARLSFFGRQ